MITYNQVSNNASTEWFYTCFPPAQATQGAQCTQRVGNATATGLYPLQHFMEEEVVAWNRSSPLVSLHFPFSFNSLGFKIPASI